MVDKRANITKEIGNLSLTGYNDIFASTANMPAEKQSEGFQGERIIEIPIAELHPPEFHPFHVKDDDAMDRRAQNIKQYGVREPGLARPRAEGGYELLSGNRRKRACELAELAVMPVIVREMDDNEAIIAIVDSNLEQRETLLYSEKAWAYKVKMEALNHSGVKNGRHSHEVLMEQTGESKNQIFRLIRLTELVASLLDKVDSKQLAFNPAVELSYLSQIEQNAVISSMETHGVKPSLSQAVKLKKLKQAEELTLDMIDKILSESKKPSSDDIKDEEISRFRRFFPKEYTACQIDEVINNLLQEWQARNGISA
jgi:ParB family chromosome partitioning protein